MHYSLFVTSLLACATAVSAKTKGALNAKGRLDHLRPPVVQVHDAHQASKRQVIERAVKSPRFLNDKTKRKYPVPSLPTLAREACRLRELQLLTLHYASP